MPADVAMDEAERIQRVLIDLERSPEIFRHRRCRSRIRNDFCYELCISIIRGTWRYSNRRSRLLRWTQRFAVIVVSGGKTDVKQGSKVPIVVASAEAGSGHGTQVEYIDVGLEIEASLDGYFDGVLLRTKVVQSSVVDEKTGVGPQDPVIRQTTLEGTSLLTPGKPLVLGSLDIPGSTRHQMLRLFPSWCGRFCAYGESAAWMIGLDQWQG